MRSCGIGVDVIAIVTLFPGVGDAITAALVGAIGPHTAPGASLFASPWSQSSSPTKQHLAAAGRHTRPCKRHWRGCRRRSHCISRPLPHSSRHRGHSHRPCRSCHRRSRRGRFAVTALKRCQPHGVLAAAGQGDGAWYRPVLPSCSMRHRVAPPPSRPPPGCSVAARHHRRDG